MEKQQLEGQDLIEEDGEPGTILNSEQRLKVIDEHLEFVLNKENGEELTKDEQELIKLLKEDKERLLKQ